MGASPLQAPARGIATTRAVAAPKKKKKGAKKKGAGKRGGAGTKNYFTKFPLQPHQAFYEAAEAPEGAPVWDPVASRRTGVVALKCGMIPDWDVWGERHPLTVLRLEDVEVTQVKTADVHGYNAIQVGGGEAKPKRVTKALAGHFEAAGVAPKIALAEFPVTEDALLEVGTPITARHFVPGQHVDIQGVTKGKGFAGVMKRWGFAGQRATHGVSKTHRHAGSTGASQDPGRTWKGKKMAGRMGGARRTAPNLLVYKIDLKRNLVFVKGAVPGHNGSYVRITDARKMSRKPERAAALGLPLPTYVPSDEEQALFEAWAAEESLPEKASDEEVALYLEETSKAPFELVVKAPDVDPFGINEWDEGE